MSISPDAWYLQGAQNVPGKTLRALTSPVFNQFQSRTKSEVYHFYGADVGAAQAYFQGNSSTLELTCLGCFSTRYTWSRNSGTKNLNRHLKECVHLAAAMSTTSSGRAQPSDHLRKIYNTLKKRLTGKGPGKASTKRRAPAKRSLTSSPVISAVASSVNNKGQRVMEPAFAGPGRQERFEKAVLNYFVQSHTPFTLIDSPAFQNLFAAAGSNVKASSKVYLNKLLTATWNETRERLWTIIKSQESHAFTTDSTKELGQTLYQAITSHYIDKQWRLNSSIIALVPVHEVRSNLMNVAPEALPIGDTPKLSAGCMTSNAADLLQLSDSIAKENIVEESFRYACSTIQHWLMQALQQKSRSVIGAYPIIVKARRIVNELSNSLNKLQWLHSLQQAEIDRLGQEMSVNEYDEFGENLHNRVPLSLIQEDPTKWRSLYHMLKRLNRLQKPIDTIMSSNTLSSGEWKELQGLLRVLAHFDAAVQFLDSEVHPTLGIVWPMVQSLAYDLTDVKLVNNLRNSGAMPQQVREDIIKDMVDTYPWVTSLPVNQELNAMLIATAVDPRFRQLQFIKFELRNQWRALIEAALLGRIQALYPEAKEHIPEMTMDGHARPGEYESVLRPQKKLRIESKAPSIEVLKNEISHYFSQESIRRSMDPLSWWRTSQKKYPNIARLARTYLAIPASLSPDPVLTNLKPAAHRDTTQLVAYT